MVAPKPTIIQKTTPNRWQGRAGQKVAAICDHIMEGTMQGTDQHFSQAKNQASSHFGVGKSGVIWQWVDVKDTAWTNGIIQKPDLTIDWLANAIAKNINPNRLTVSIEHEGYTGEPMPEAQYNATLALHKWLISQFNIPIDRKHIIGHYQIDNVKRPNCPGSGFQWARLMADLTAFFKPVTPKPPALPFSQQFPETGYTVDDAQGFLSFWREHGGLEIFGYPISGVFEQDGKQVQYFERARFEYDATSEGVQLGLVGREALALRK